MADDINAVQAVVVAVLESDIDPLAFVVLVAADLNDWDEGCSDEFSFTHKV